MQNPVVKFLSELCEDPFLRRSFAASPESRLAVACIDGASASALLGSDSAAIYEAAQVDPAPAPKLIWSR